MAFPEDRLGDLLEALRYAAEMHRDQRRKNKFASPYINHLIDVLEILWRLGGVRDPVTLIGGVLHDTLEDTAATQDEIRGRFGERVLAVVLEVTDDKTLPKAERKRRQIDEAAGKSQRAREIKLADKIANVRDIAMSPPKGWPRAPRRQYVQWARRVVDGLRGANPALESTFDQIAAEAEQHLA